MLPNLTLHAPLSIGFIAAEHFLVTVDLDLLIFNFYYDYFESSMSGRMNCQGV